MPAAPFHLFIGTYTRAGGEGIYALQLDPASGEFSRPTVAAVTPNPSYLTLSPDRTTLYSVREADAMAAAHRVASDRQQLSPLPGPQPAGGKAPCHLATDATGRVLLVANYHTGVVASLPIAPDGTLGPAASVIQHEGASVNPERQSSAHAHCVTVSPDNRFVLVCDLGLDKIFTYRLDGDTATITPAEPPFARTAPGAGPRHLVFSRNGKHAFMVSEMGATLTSYGYDERNGALHELDSQSTLEGASQVENKSAAVRVHPSGRYIYASNRGPDTLAVFAFDEATGKLVRVQSVPAGGQAPRDFAISPDGKWLVAANQDSNSLTLFRVSPETGQLTRAPATAEISMPVCVLFAD
ncbi:MAG TPA: lactonase family protein [Opitutus sp.]|nr:lactonase family protein [Opitutus sp.]